MNAEPTNLLLLRHAEVDARYHRIFGGKIDMDLSPRGHEQAAALAKYLEHRRFDALYASPMKRVQQTLAPLALATGLVPVPADGLREVDFGDWTGLGWEQVREKFNISAFDWVSQLESGSIPNAESGGVFRARVEPCIHEIIRNHLGRNIGVICHGGTIRMILSILLDLPFPKTAYFEIEYASLTEIKLLPHRAEVQLLNFTPWRDLK